MKGTEFQFSIPEKLEETTPLFQSILELIVMTLKVPRLSINGADKLGFLLLSSSNHYKHLSELGNMFINGKISLEDFLPNLRSNTNISDATLIKRKGKRIYAAKMLRNYVSGVNERLQDVLLTVKRCGGRNYISLFKIVNHNKRHLSKPKELAKMIETGKIRRGDWFIYDGGLKSGENLKEARKAGVRVVTRLNINFVVHRFGKAIRKEDILSGVKAIKRTIDGVPYTIYEFKRCIWQGTMGNLFLIRGEGYNDFIPLFTTALNSKPETVIRKYKERFLIEITNKELKSYLNIEGNYFRTKESNYGFFFLICLVYNLVQCVHSELPDIRFKDVLEHLSSYLLYVDPPKCVFAIDEPFKSLLRDIGYAVPNKMNTRLAEAIILSGVVAT